MTEREKFEKLACDMGFSDMLKRDEYGYQDHSVQAAYDGYIAGVQAATKAAVPEWIKVRDGLPKCGKPVWIITKGEVSQFQWIYDAGDDDCWFEPWTPHFTDGSTLDIDSVEMWAYCDLPPAAPEVNE